MKIKIITLLFLPISILAMQQSIDYNAQLLKAAMSGDLETLKSAIANGADIEIKNQYQATPLLLAVSNDQVSAIEVLLKANANIEAKTKKQKTALHLATLKNNVGAVEVLLKANANIEAKDINQSTPLHVAACYGYLPILQVLLKAGADIKAKAQNEITALLLAARQNHLSAVEILLKAGADTEIVHNIYGYGLSTLLQEAIAQNKTELIKLLLKYGAKSVYDHSDLKIFANILDNNSIKPVKLLFEYNIIFSEEILQKLIKLLVENNINREVLRAAIFDKPKRISSILKSNRANYEQLNAKDTTGTTPLMWASARGNSEIVKALMDYRRENKIIIDLLEANDLGENAIDLAIEHKKLLSLKRLQKATYIQAKTVISDSLFKLIARSIENSIERIETEQPYNPNLFIIIIAQYLSGTSGNVCNYCNAPEAENSCQCYQVKYCSTDCQKKHWKSHKAVFHQENDEE